jgi:hypothetical protein
MMLTHAWPLLNNSSHSKSRGPIPPLSLLSRYLLLIFGLNRLQVRKKLLTAIQPVRPSAFLGVARETIASRRDIG